MGPTIIEITCAFVDNAVKELATRDVDYTGSNDITHTFNKRGYLLSKAGFRTNTSKTYLAGSGR
jgi:K+-transporting ATPase c subunit